MLPRFSATFRLLLFSVIAMSAWTEQINFPAATITSVSPTSIPAGSPQSYLTIKGVNLIQPSQPGYSLSPGGSATPLAINQYISTNELIATLPANLLQN